MTATYEDLVKWFDEAKKEGAAYLIIACDGFDHDNYPVHVKPGDDFYTVYDRVASGDMQFVDEVYDMSRGMDVQRTEPNGRAMNMPARRA